MSIKQQHIELTGYKAADLIEQISNNKNAISVCSKAFDHAAPDGEKLQVQIVVTRELDLMLRDNQVDTIEYEG